MDKKELGSKTAKGGFVNEKFVVDEFNAWQDSHLAKSWLEAMGYKISTIKSVKAVKIKGSYKADLQVQISLIIEFKDLIEAQNLQVKLVSNPQGFNQIDKRWVKNYQELWGFSDEILEILKFYTGENTPKIANPRDKRRMFFDEMHQNERNLILTWFKQNQILVLNDILKGRGKFAAEWFLVILRIDENLQWILKSINEVINFYSSEVLITKQGNLKIGKIGMQRKGGDGGRETAKILQFKLNLCEILKQKAI